MELVDRIARVSAVDLAESPRVDAAIADTVRYLGSDEALRSIEVDTYWPKWDSPWWHMVVMWELGLARRIPERVVRAMIDGLNALPVKIFPIRPGDVPAGVEVNLQTSCHCALGSMYQVVTACGLDADRELPWATPWFLRYQMSDGGLTCDNDAYLVADECPSSMVGTVPSLETMLLGPLTPEREAFVDRAADFLIGREVRRGSASKHNAEEREREPAWLLPCFPRLYLYDVIRGLSALTRWAELRRRAIPLAAIEPVVIHLVTTFPDGLVRLGRRSFEGIGTRKQEANGVWGRYPEASHFALLDATSTVGEPSPAVTRQWQATRARLLALHDAKLLS